MSKRFRRATEKLIELLKKPRKAILKMIHLYWNNIRESVK